MAEISEEDREHLKTWSELNPEYRHEVLTDEMMEDYVKEHFHVSHPEIESVYFDVKDSILRSDLIRYLILLAEGGVYNDLDVGCEKPIKSWVPPQYEESAGTLLGIEVDNKFGPDGRTFQGGQDLFQLVNWTIMSKPNQPFMWFLVRRVLKNINDLAASQNKQISALEYSIQDVLDVTGPGALTKVFFDYASDITDTNITYRNFTKMTKPRMIGEVVILPIQAFGGGHQVEWAGMKKDGSELVHHYFAGSWKTDHDDKPPQIQTPDSASQNKEQDFNHTEEEEKKKKMEQEKLDKEAEAQRLAKEITEQGETQKAEMNNVQAGNITPDSPIESSTAAESKPAEIKVAEQISEKQVTNDKLASTQHTDESTAKNNSVDEQPTEKEPMTDKINKVKAEKEQEAAESKAKAEQEEAVKQKLADVAAKTQAAEEAAARQKATKEKAAAEKKAQEEKEANMTQEEKEEEERKRKWAEVVAAAPKEAKLKTNEEKQQVTNDLADYDFLPD